MLLRKFGILWHRLISKFPVPLARLYLLVVGKLLKQAPDNLWKQRIVNSITQAEWDERITFPPQPVRLVTHASVWLTPHLQEFDRDALFFQRLPYESEVFDWMATGFEQYDAVIEIGANVGVFTLFLGALAQKQQKRVPIFTFEPSRKAYQRLLENLDHNPMLQDITPFNVAIADATGFLAFYEPEGHLTNGSLQQNFSEQFSDTVNQATVVGLDASYVATLVKDYHHILLKIDVEGAEPMVL